jgi:hypothetical protein
MARLAVSLAALLLLLTPPPVAGQPRCGSDRWAVKTLTDLDRDRVWFQPVSASIQTLVAIPIPEVPYPADRRLAPQELTTYTIRGRMIARLMEADQDVHILMEDTDAPGVTLIVEVPLGACAAGSSLQAKFDAVRAEVLSMPMSSVIRVTGVGFFDCLHNARGQTPNGFELHPVFQVEWESDTDGR